MNSYPIDWERLYLKRANGTKAFKAENDKEYYRQINGQRKDNQ